ncbi:MAG: hypothetical protein K8R37_04795, partial [Bacteroidales bacterium]|nr:hypothetical protein [Bacteroidales bacterium]
ESSWLRYKRDCSIDAANIRVFLCILLFDVSNITLVTNMFFANLISFGIIKCIRIPQLFSV